MLTFPDVWIGDAADIRERFDNNFYGRCNCSLEVSNGVCNERCLNRVSFQECDSKNCSVSKDRCLNRPFTHLRENFKASAAKSLWLERFAEGVEIMDAGVRGYGLRAVRSFEPNQVIMEYCGEVVTQEDGEERMCKEYKKDKCHYLMQFVSGTILDATQKGSIARFVNRKYRTHIKD